MSLLPSILYIGEYPSRENYNPDIMVLPDHSIASVRQIVNFFSTNPIKSSHKTVVINQAHLLQIPAQNALLKTLEEPGEHNQIHLYTLHPQKLLKTIRSRCQVINLGQSVVTHNYASLPVHKTPLADKLLLSDTLSKDKERVGDTLLDFLNQAQTQLQKDPSEQNIKLAKSILKAIKMHQHNVDPKSIFDWLFLTN